jgi:hypothetical protein
VQTFDVGVKNSVPIQPIGKEDLVLASDATAWRTDASLLVSTSPANGRVWQLRQWLN